ncbi:hypothetical protein [Nitrosopumilus sp.]|uniref:hypothetical protein n=1 Tax=Nitrosopumilus sp. TaxID=2024843 RepID=UPI003B59BE79
MSVNPDLLEILMKNTQEDNTLEFFLHLNDFVFPIGGVSIMNSPTPVNEPTTRGGVYFSDKFAYKMKGTLHDLSVVSSLTKKMLGPNTEFGRLKITSNIEVDGKKMPIQIFTNLTNSVQSPNSIELSMIIIELDYC